MDNDLKVKQLICSMKSTRVPDVDVTNSVMKRVRALHFHRNIRGKGGRRLQQYPIIVTACILLFITTISVSAAALFKTDWNGIQISIGSTAEKVVTDGTDSYIHLQEALSTSTDVWKIVSSETAEEQLDFTMLNPERQNELYVLSKSFGVLPTENNYKLKSADEEWLGGIYDVIRWGQKDILIKQNLDQEMTEALLGQKSLAVSFVNDPWEHIELADDALAMFTATGKENVLVIKYKTADNKVISLELQGDLTKEQLVRLGSDYIGL